MSDLPWHRAARRRAESGPISPCPHEQAEGDGGEDRRAGFRRTLEDVQVGEGARCVDQEHAQEESGITDAIDDKSLLSGIGWICAQTKKPMSKYELRPTPPSRRTSPGNCSR